MARDTSEARASEQGEEDATSASTSDSLCGEGPSPSPRLIKAARQSENNIREMLRFFPKETCHRRRGHVLGCTTCQRLDLCNHYDPCWSVPGSSTVEHPQRAIASPNLAQAPASARE